MTTPNPACLVNGSPTPADVSASATVTGALANPAGVVYWFLEVQSADETTNVATIQASLAINQTAKTFSLTAPGAAGTKIILQSTVGVSEQSAQGFGRDINGEVQASYTTTFAVNVPTAAGLRVIAASEITEQNTVVGWLAEINACIRAAAGGGLPAGATIGQTLFAGASGVPAWTTISGDVSPSVVTPGKLTVTGLQGLAVPAPTVSSTFLEYNGTSLVWAAAGAGSGITALTGDVTASGSGSVAAAVVAVHGATVPSAGALTTGNVLQVTGASALGYAPVNLAGGANFVTGLLPTTNGGLGLAISGSPAAGSTIVATSPSAAAWTPYTAFTNTVVFQPGGTAGGHVYTTEATLKAAVSSITGAKWICVDDTFAAPIFSTAWNIDQCTFYGSRGYLATPDIVTLTWATGSTATFNVLILYNVKFASTSTSAIANLSGKTNIQGTYCHIGGSASAPWVNYASGTGHVIVCHNTSFFGSPNSVTVAAGSSLFIYGFDQTTSQAHAFGGLGTVSQTFDASSFANTTQDVSTFVTTILDVSSRVGYVDTTVSPTIGYTTVQDALDFYKSHVGASVAIGNTPPGSGYTLISTSSSAATWQVGSGALPGGATAGQFLVEGASVPAWTTISGDLEASTSTPGQMWVDSISGHAGSGVVQVKTTQLDFYMGQITAIATMRSPSGNFQFYPLSGTSQLGAASFPWTSVATTTMILNGVSCTGAATTGYVLTATSSSAASWQAPSGGGGGPPTGAAGGDLTGSTYPNPRISSISGSGGGGGTVAANIAVLNFTGSTGTLEIGAHPFLSASTTNVVLEAPGASGFVGLATNAGGTPLFYFQSVSGVPGIYGAANGGASASATNFAIISNSAVTVLNGVSALALSINGVGLFELGSAGFTIGTASIAMTSSNHTLSAAEYISPIIAVTGTISGTPQLIFPDTAGRWDVDFSGAILTGGSVAMKNSSGSYVVSLGLQQTAFTVITTGSSFAAG
jgi:hypothetical protein